jgi:hypothetical protein
VSDVHNPLCVNEPLNRRGAYAASKPRTNLAKLFLGAGFLASFVAFSPSLAMAQCNPQPNKPFPRAEGLFVTYDSSIQTRQTAVVDGAMGWNYALGAAFSPFQFNTGDGVNIPGVLNQIYVQVGDTQGEVARSSIFCDAQQCYGGSITFNQDEISNWSNRYLTWVTMHELGHHMGFGDVLCDARDSIMAWSSDWQSHNNIALQAPAQAERVSLITYYQEPQPCWGGSTECSPIVLDLDHDGRISTSGPDVYFDLDGFGSPAFFGWTAAGSGDGFLFLDRNGNGVVDNGLELFGNRTPVSWGMDPRTPKATNGFEALRWLDQLPQGGNDDGAIDRADGVFERLRLWIDRNHDGICDPAEVNTLSDAGVRRLNLNYRETRRRDEFGNELKFAAIADAVDGGQRRRMLVVDVFFVTVQ